MDDPRFQRGIDAYARGDFFAAHEHLEDVWRELPRGPDRTLMQGLIQLAVAMHKIVVERKPSPGARILGRAIDKIADAPARRWGLDLSMTLDAARRVRATLPDATEVPPLTAHVGTEN